MSTGTGAAYDGRAADRGPGGSAKRQYKKQDKGGTTHYERNYTSTISSFIEAP